MHTLSKMTTDELVDVLVGRSEMPIGGPYNQHAWDVLIDLIDKRLTPEQMAKLDAELMG
jgi:hypothetical protein